VFGRHLNSYAVGEKLSLFTVNQIRRRSKNTDNASLP
jgi:hypothetical protein